jgi:hypothetical protein
MLLTQALHSVVQQDGRRSPTIFRRRARKG